MLILVLVSNLKFSFLETWFFYFSNTIRTCSHPNHPCPRKRWLKPAWVFYWLNDKSRKNVLQRPRVKNSHEIIITTFTSNNALWRHIFHIHCFPLWDWREKVSLWGVIWPRSTQSEWALLEKQYPHYNKTFFNTRLCIKNLGFHFCIVDFFRFFDKTHCSHCRPQCCK